LTNPPGRERERDVDELLQKLADELDELAQALTGVACGAELLQQTGDEELLELIKEQSRRAIQTHKHLVGLCKEARDGRIPDTL
jgi:NTP pyrophosphatase (non-canonical NTP hydrolase)